VAPKAPAAQLVLAAAVLKLPDGHLVQAPPAALISPAVHARQLLAEVARPAVEERPAGQSAQSSGALVEPVVALHLPAAQPAAQVEAPVVAAKRPPGHAAHAPKVVGLENWPAGQALQLEPETAKPLAQAVIAIFKTAPVLPIRKRTNAPEGSIARASPSDGAV
jgi:hypothetical protein